MKEHVQKIKFLSEHTGIITIGLASAGFVVAYLQALVLSGGQLSIANYIISEVGVTAMWTNAVVLVLGSAIQSLFLIMVLRTKGDFSLTYGAAVNGMIWVFFWSIMPLLFFATLLVTFLGIFLLKRYHKRKSSAEVKTFRTNLLALSFTSFMFLGIFFYPTLPITLIEDDNGLREKIYILADKGEYLLAVHSSSPKKIKTIDVDTIKSRSLCENKKPWFFYNFSGAIDGNRHLLDDCPESI